MQLLWIGGEPNSRLFLSGGLMLRWRCVLPIIMKSSFVLSQGQFCPQSRTNLSFIKDRFVLHFVAP